MSWFLSSHGSTRAHLKRIGVAENDICICTLGPQTTQHLLECPILNSTQRNNEKLKNILELNSQASISEFLKYKQHIETLTSRIFQRLKVMSSQVDSQQYETNCTPTASNC